MRQDIRNLFAVSVQMAWNRPDTGGTVPFFTTVSPQEQQQRRRRRTADGREPAPGLRGKQCFVTTAA